MERNLLLAILGKYKHLGTEYIPHTWATLIGRASHIGSEAWLNSMYDALSECDVMAMEKSIGRKILTQYRDFLLNCSNGLNIMKS